MAANSARRYNMANYLMLFRLTQQGVKDIKTSPARIKASKELITRMGGRVKEFYGLMGSYDSVFVIEAPDDEAVAKMAFSISAQGNVRTETLRAYSEDEFRGIVETLP
jgi:uncharacterized protein with GYD domain